MQEPAINQNPDLRSLSSNRLDAIATLEDVVRRDFHDSKRSWLMIDLELN